MPTTPLARVRGPVTRPVAPLVVLRGGLTVPLDALQFAWSLEDRGATLAIDAGDLVIEGPPGFLTADDCTALGRWQGPLQAMARYRIPEGVA